MSLRPKQGRVALSILGVKIPGAESNIFAHLKLKNRVHIKLKIFIFHRHNVCVA